MLSCIKPCEGISYPPGSTKFGQTDGCHLYFNCCNNTNILPILSTFHLESNCSAVNIQMQSLAVTPRKNLSRQGRGGYLTWGSGSPSGTPVAPSGCRASGGSPSTSGCSCCCLDAPVDRSHIHSLLSSRGSRQTGDIHSFTQRPVISMGKVRFWMG